MRSWIRDATPVRTECITYMYRPEHDVSADSGPDASEWVSEFDERHTARLCAAASAPQD
ncbi:uncharacterized protein FOMMEDRAFT_21947 [Fomitiporia mediterranea MF3/22]|uniref:uncharacterized protein n=1 Tax=Fomitiporia mediterranea (strain MF3/22) TaxID=694068 RepID=UPI0004408307|nr:uncharacterized protein FOMMEDRAFT_21947 [Fomitiporia mediterranea MF3/22]EJD01588.1 hypothetical protein FOMMEDRAFT_21947 [Fomitiporia mediterranea MF3/22]